MPHLPRLGALSALTDHPAVALAAGAAPEPGDLREADLPNAHTWLPSVKPGGCSRLEQRPPVLAAVKQGALVGGCGPAVVMDAGNGREKGLAFVRRVVGGRVREVTFRSSDAGVEAGRAGASSRPHVSTRVR